MKTKLKQNKWTYLVQEGNYICSIEKERNNYNGNPRYRLKVFVKDNDVYYSYLGNRIVSRYGTPEDIGRNFLSEYIKETKKERV